MSGMLSQEDFASLVTRLGMTLSEAELTLLREGYDGLQVMLARLPATAALTDEPSFVQLPSGARVVA